MAGTKGKGSTCAFTESILRQYGYKTGFFRYWKNSLEIDCFWNQSNFSSPHLIEARERIRINGELLSKEKFVNYFWQCYNSIDNAVQKSTDEVRRLVLKSGRELFWNWRKINHRNKVYPYYSWKFWESSKSFDHLGKGKGAAPLISRSWRSPAEMEALPVDLL